MKDMLEILADYLNDAGLLTGWSWQYELWSDTGKPKDRFIVIQSNGGTAMSKDLGNDYYFSIYVIGRQGINEYIEETKAKALEIIGYIQENPLGGCVGSIHMQAPLGRPAQTDEKRVVYELLIRCVN